MTPMSEPVPGETLAEAGERIRSAVPIRGDRATDADCRDRRRLIDDTLAARDVQPGARVWHTAQLIDGRIAGVWARSAEEAELSLTVWWDVPCHWVRPDPDARLHREYFPRGKRSATEADRRFPLTLPRHVRDQFAPTDALFDATVLPGGRATDPSRS